MYARKATRDKTYVEIGEKRTHAQIWVDDCAPIVGIGESLLPVEAELRRIDEETKEKIKSNETETETVADDFRSGGSVLDSGLLAVVS